jgi:Ser/Thr protein kinase RdoA (MazF antagonist)
MSTEPDLRAVVARFALDADAVRVERLAGGHINDTYVVELSDGRRYVLQRINAHVFRQASAVIENTARVVAHVERRAPGLVPRLVRARSGDAGIVDETGAWRMLVYVEDGRTATLPLDDAAARAAGEAFGRFQAVLADYPVEGYVQPIPQFLELAPRYADLDAVLSDPNGQPVRRDAAHDVVRELLRRRGAVTLGESGPTGLIHADTKITNVLFERNSSRVLAVLDLDTVMVGRRAWDFGDLVRSAAASGGEDTAGLALDIDVFAALAQGFIAGLGALDSPDLRAALVTAPRYITLTLAVRFLVDYLQGDRYFRVDDVEHNLRRARAQLSLVRSQERFEPDMRRIIGGL